MNLGRACGCLAPVPQVRRILNLKRKVYRSNREHEATGREMPFHFRRGRPQNFSRRPIQGGEGQDGDGTGPVRNPVWRVGCS